uniref:GDSL esterase/lipase 7 n=1 Tax=Chenopodium quinoa TaxID=63459 RepID=A0A803LC76_CHEQI
MYISLFFTNFLCTKCISPPPLVPALYIFGDSIFDSGNNNLLPTLAKANYPPYGHEFPGGIPTGRFTNGKTVVDFIADYLGLPYPPPRIASLSTLLRSKSYMGYNYASGSCGILIETGKFIGECLNLDEQMVMFEETVKKLSRSKFKTSTELSQHMAKSIFIFSVGNNDYINTYFGILNTRLQYNPQQFAQLLTKKLSLKLKKLYDLGARKIVVFELVLLKSLTSTLQDSHFIIGKAHGLGYDAVINPTKYGLSDSSNSCCDSWINGTLSCKPGRTPCSNPDEHYFWDGYHPTQATYSVIASHCINGSDVCVPMNIQQLVQVLNSFACMES